LSVALTDSAHRCADVGIEEGGEEMRGRGKEKLEEKKWKTGRMKKK
jgi:hypothetical protein